MKKTFFLLALAMLPFFAWAVTLGVPSSLPSNVNWSFSASLDPSDSFEYSVMLLDNQKLLTVYPNGQTVKDPFNGQFVLTGFVVDSDPASTFGLTLYASVIGLAAGRHELKIETFQSGALKDSQLVSIDFFVPLPESFSSRFDATISSITTVTDNIKEKNREIEEKMLSIQNEFTETQTYVNEINSKYRAELDEFVKKQESVLQELENKKAELGKEPAQPEPAAEETTESEESQDLLLQKPLDFPTALASLQKVSWLHVFLALIAAGLFVLFVLRRIGGKSQKKSGAPEDELFDDEVEASMEEQKEKGKWAVK